MSSLSDKRKAFSAVLSRAGSLLKLESWRAYFRKPSEAVTLVLLSNRHTEIRKIRLSPQIVWFAKLGAAFSVGLVFLSAVFLFDYLSTLPERTLMDRENKALRGELNKLQYHLDSLQISVDRMARFDQKLRALTDVDKQIAKLKGPVGQGGSTVTQEGEDVFDFGDFQIKEAQLDVDADSNRFLDRQQVFLVQKLFHWMKRLYRDSELQEQSLEELFEVLKGREVQIAATPSILPARGWVTSHFGFRLDPFSGRRAFHEGLDVVARVGTPVMAPAEGVITFSGPYGSYGNTVQIFHGYGVATRYAHLEATAVRVGQKVKRGEIIGAIGNTGRSTGAHLHYEVIVHGVQVDPRKFVLDRGI